MVDCCLLVFVVRCLLFDCRCRLFVVGGCCMLRVVWCGLCVARRLSLVALLSVARCLVIVASCSLMSVVCSWCVAGCVMSVTRCLWFVVRCVSFACC